MFFVGVLIVNDKKVGSGAGSRSVSQRHGSADFDPHQNATNPDTGHI